MTVDPWSELATLTAALCDGVLTPEQAARLEELAGESDDVRRYVVQYIQLHGELYWDLAAAAARGEDGKARAGEQGPVAGVSSDRGRRLARVSGWIAVAAAAVLLIAAGTWLLARRTHDQHEIALSSSPVATLTRMFHAECTRRNAPLAEGADLMAGDQVDLPAGLAEIAFATGARAIIEGPARFDLESPRGFVLRFGKACVEAPGSAAGFTVTTPRMSVVDLGTEFGLVVERETGVCEVHVLSGKVELGPSRIVSAGGNVWGRVEAGQAVRIRVEGNSVQAAPPIERIAHRAADFVRSLPAPGGGSVAVLRRLVERDPRLLHHYTFEGSTSEQRLRDRCGSLQLTEVVMRDGRGGATSVPSTNGFDATTRAVAPCRDTKAGNSQGMALQSETPFDPPPEMTVELLLKFDPGDPLPEGAIAAAIATRQSERSCGFLVTAVDWGQLALLLDGDAAWQVGEGDFAFVPGDWYYMAATFHAGTAQTRVNVFAANLNRGETKLAWVVRDRWVPGVPAASRLGIGKAFDADLAHAYPWPGALDEVAIYRAVLDRGTLGQHLAAVIQNTVETMKEAP